MRLQPGDCPRPSCGRPELRIHRGRTRSHVSPPDPWSRMISQSRIPDGARRSGRPGACRRARRARRRLPPRTGCRETAKVADVKVCTVHHQERQQLSKVPTYDQNCQWKPLEPMLCWPEPRELNLHVCERVSDRHHARHHLGAKRRQLWAVHAGYREKRVCPVATVTAGVGRRDAHPWCMQLSTRGDATDCSQGPWQHACSTTYHSCLTTLFFSAVMCIVRL